MVRKIEVSIVFLLGLAVAYRLWERHMEEATALLLLLLVSLAMHLRLDHMKVNPEHYRPEPDSGVVLGALCCPLVFAAKLISDQHTNTSHLFWLSSLCSIVCLFNLAHGSTCLPRSVPRAGGTGLAVCVLLSLVNAWEQHQDSDAAPVHLMGSVAFCVLILYLVQEGLCRGFARSFTAGEATCVGTAFTLLLHSTVTTTFRILSWRYGLQHVLWAPITQVDAVVRADALFPRDACSGVNQRVCPVQVLVSQSLLSGVLCSAVLVKDFFQTRASPWTPAAISFAYLRLLLCIVGPHRHPRMLQACVGVCVCSTVHDLCAGASQALCIHGSGFWSAASPLVGCGAT